MLFMLIIGLAGFAILFKGECRASSKRVVRGWAASVVGFMFVIAAALAWVPQLHFGISVGITVGAIVLGLVTAKPRDERSHS